MPRHSDRTLVNARSRPVAVAATVLLASLCSEARGAIRFVNDNAPGGIHNGVSWFTAYTSLQAALAAASAGDQIWVAAGTYKPSVINNRSESFFLVQGVEVYGGFSGTETLLSQRDVAANLTILSGDIGVVGNKADNSFHVVQTANSISTVTHLDGFIIVDGNANGGGVDNLGGGMKNNGMPTVRNCVFVGNACVTNGAAVLNTSPLATTSQFQNCVFINNAGSTAVSIQNGPVNLVNCTIANNSGIGLQLLNSSPAFVRNTIVYDNGGGNLESNQVQVTNSSTSFAFCCIEGLTGSLGGVGNVSGSPEFVDINGPDNVLGTIDDDARLRGSSSCIDAGSTAILPNDGDDLDGDGDSAESIPFDRDGDDRQIEDLVANTGAGALPPVDIGAYEFKRSVRTILVNAAATGANNGTTWADAYVDIQSGLDELADVKFGGPGEIWVAQGTYKPSFPAGRSATFKMVAQVELYGGFTGAEGSRSQRDPFANKTVLSGEIGVAGSASDNCFHVVTADGSTLFGSAPVLDGFVIAGGNANGAAIDGDNIGGGILCQNQTANDPVFRNCLIVGNKATSIGGGALCNSTDVSFISCVFSGNAANSGGGVSCINVGSPKIVNCTIARNTSASSVSGGLTTSGAGQNAQVVNCVLAGNSIQLGVSDTQFAQINLPSGSINYSCVEGLTGSLGGTGNIAALPFFTDPDGSDDVFGTPDDDYRLLACSSVIDAANTTALPADADDLDDDGNVGEVLSIDAQGLSRVFGDVGVPDSGLGAGDMGAYEFHGVSGGSCPADCFPVGGNDTVDVDDLFTVINHWGGCAGNPCQGDTSPACGDGVVDIDDLFVVINHWGFCP